MPISQRTATSGTAASSAAFTITLPTGTTDGDFIVIGVSNAGTTNPNAPTGWTKVGPSSAGSGQAVSAFYAQYSASLTLNFTNVASVASWVCNSYLQAGAILFI